VSESPRSPPPPLARLLERALNAALAMDPESLERSGALAGKVVCVVLSGAGVALALRFAAGRVEVLAQTPAAPDVTVRGPPFTLLAAVMAGDEEALLGGGLEVTGDVALARRVQRLVAGLDLDIEELLARRVGDVAAHELGNLARGAQALAAHAREKLLADVGELLLEEGRAVAARAELERFADEVDRLRDDVERMDERVARLARPGPSRAGRPT